MMTVDFAGRIEEDRMPMVKSFEEGLALSGAVVEE